MTREPWHAYRVILAIDRNAHALLCAAAFFAAHLSSSHDTYATYSDHSTRFNAAVYHRPFHAQTRPISFFSLAVPNREILLFATGEDMINT